MTTDKTMDNPQSTSLPDQPIDGCIIEPLSRFNDERGWLTELFREDDLPAELLPAMAYISSTKPGITRGPHEHREQTDIFVFFHGQYRLYLWDNRRDSPTHGNHLVRELGENEPARVIVPPGVVHGYRNIGNTHALIINCPDKLYAGHGRQHPVDEIRHESLADSPFRME